jgi:hypothetical protein
MSTPTRTAVVTGAAIAKRLSEDGFAVAVLDLDESDCKPVVDEIESAGGSAPAVGVDVVDEQAVQAAVAEVADELEPPTVLVNNAGVTRDNLPFKMTADDWDAVTGMHLRGSFLMSRATQRYMIDAGWGRIVNLSSVSALGNRGQVNYSAAKAWPAGLHQDTGDRARPIRRHGQRRRTGLHRNGHDRCRGGPLRHELRRLQGCRGGPDPGRPRRPARGHRGNRVVLRTRRVLVRFQSGPLRRRRPAVMTSGDRDLTRPLTPVRFRENYRVDGSQKG